MSVCGTVQMWAGNPTRVGNISDLQGTGEGNIWMLGWEYINIYILYMGDLPRDLHLHMRQPAAPETRRGPGSPGGAGGAGGRRRSARGGGQ